MTTRRKGSLKGIEVELVVRVIIFKELIRSVNTGED
jgi:hypothetical protein